MSHGTFLANALSTSPLTSRVAVNRFWENYFGTGICKSSEDLGTQAEWPSHPELLDWLATELIATGWDVKAIVRKIVVSATYRQTSAMGERVKGSRGGRAVEVRFDTAAAFVETRWQGGAVIEMTRLPAGVTFAALPASGRILMSGLDYERSVLAAGCVGIMQSCMDIVVPYVHDRKQFGQPIGAFQLMQAKIADMYVTLNASKSYVYAVARACDRGETTREDAAGAILYAAGLVLMVYATTPLTMNLSAGVIMGFGLAGCSVIIAPYRNSREQIVGAVGVIGPTRINYARIIPMVDYTAQVIGRILA